MKLAFNREINPAMHVVCTCIVPVYGLGNAKWQYFRLHLCRRDESLWRRIDLAQKTIKPRTLGKLISLGTTHLRLARADVSFSLIAFRPDITVMVGWALKINYLSLIAWLLLFSFF